MASASTAKSERKLAKYTAKRLAAARGEKVPLTVAGWVRFALRAFGILLLLLVFVPLHYLYRIFAYGSPFPMLFLRFTAWIVGARVKIVGTLDLLPAATARRLKEAAELTSGRTGTHVNVAVGYGGRQEIADAVQSLVGDKIAEGLTGEELVRSIDVSGIDGHLYTSGQPDPDLVIRTSGEQRLSGFLLWQSAYSEIWFTEAYWPEFRRVDFLRALRDYAARHRRFGA